jgi:hypothetical protein
MTATEQKEIFRQALALPLKARLDLYKRLTKSLESPAKQGKAVPDARVVAEQAAVYGRRKAPKRAKTASSKAEVLSRKEWNEAWMKELKIRAEEMESGADPGVPLDDVLKILDEKPRRRP